MAKTWNQQYHVWPNFTTGTIFTEGDGMHSFVPFESPRILNNLLAYCARPVGYCQGGSAAVTYLQQSLATTGNDRETFIAQVPTPVPKWAKRMQWTCAVKIFADTAEDTSLSALTVYLSPNHYTGAGGSTSTADTFDTTMLNDGYRATSTAAVLSVDDNETSAYTLVDEFTAGMVDPPGFNTVFPDGPGAYLILTATGNGSGEATTANNIKVYDFTWTFAPE